MMLEHDTKKMPVRRPYKTPTVVHYGLLADLTKSSTVGGTMDGGPMGSDKTF